MFPLDDLFPLHLAHAFLSIPIREVLALGWRWRWMSSNLQGEPLSLPLNMTVLIGEDAGRGWLEASKRDRRYPATTPPWGSNGLSLGKLDIRSLGNPPHWDSSQCMERWGVSKLQMEPDPRGYLVFTEGREQLGNNRFLLSDGLVIAKTLNRTLVEFPVADSRIATPFARLGFCDYWDCTALCSYHRILGLDAFRLMLRKGLLTADGFVSVVSADWEQRLLPGLETEESITDFFWEFQDSQVIELRMAWKSGLRREPVELLRPKLFYTELVRRLLIRHEGWLKGLFLAVQWRTETSTGNLTECYLTHVVPAVNEHLNRLNLGRDDVFFNIDLIDQASTTYDTSIVEANQGVVDRIRTDYPAAINNAVYEFLVDVQDAGIRAMTGGLVSASAGFLLTSSFNASSSDLCQKPHSKYIDLVVEWRLGLLEKDPRSIGELFPNFDEDPTPAGRGSITPPLLVLLLVAAAAAFCAAASSTQSRARLRLKSS